MGGHSSGGLFGQTLGRESMPLYVEVISNSLESKLGPKPVNNPIVDSVRTHSALKLDKDHAFPDIVDNYVEYARQFNLVGRDGVTRRLYQLKGSLNGVEGIFEWILDPNPSRGVTHRRFIGGGKITGVPNQMIRKA